MRVGIRELKNQATEIIRDVRTNRTEYVITYYGQPVAVLLPLPLLYLSAFFYRRRQDYYDLLFAISERGAWQEWVSFFLQGITEQANDAILRVKRLQDLQAGRREKLTQARASALLLHLADHLFTAPVITIPEAQRILDVTYPTAQRNVARLESVGILRQVGESRYGKTFIAHEIMRVVGTNER